MILFTGKGSEEIASEAVSAGVTDSLQKQSGTEQYEVLVNRIRNAGEQSDSNVTDDGFYVADDGPGIPPEERERIFESGYSRSPDGTGY